jgi:hypothetical protein
MVRQRLGIAEEDPADTAAGKLAQGLDRFVPDPGERAYGGRELGGVLGVAFGGRGGGRVKRGGLFAGWRLFFERLAAEGPVALLIEDAQCADAGLLDFLDYLTDWARDLPIYVLVLARPELGQARPGFGAGRNRTTLTLDPLDAASMDALVEALVPGMPAPARAKITAQAQGIPLFAVETVRSLIDRDIVQPIEGSYRLVGDVGELSVPDSLHALLAARLDALDPDVRQLVADAAVLGTTFPAEALIAVSGQDETVVRAALAELVRREVFMVSADPLSPEKGSYGFAQHMLRQGAYDTLPRRDRKPPHLAAAAHLRAAFCGDGEEVADVIARHYLDALDAVPADPDAGQIRGQAIAALVRAAERAGRTGAPAAAAASYASPTATRGFSRGGGPPLRGVAGTRRPRRPPTPAGPPRSSRWPGRELYRRGGDTPPAAAPGGRRAGAAAVGGHARRASSSPAAWCYGPPRTGPVQAWADSGVEEFSRTGGGSLSAGERPLPGLTVADATLVTTNTRGSATAPRGRPQAAAARRPPGRHSGRHCRSRAAR